jgi:hypothetical protein
MKIPKNKLIKVYWKDHYFQGSWDSISEMEKTAEKGFNELCTTVGECIINKSGYIVMASSFNGDNEFGNIAMILKKDIIKYEKLQ